MTGDFIDRGARPPRSASTTGWCRRSGCWPRRPSLRRACSPGGHHSPWASPRTRSTARRRWISAPPFEAEAQAQAACMLNPNFREAYEAFRAKRRAEVRVAAVRCPASRSRSHSVRAFLEPAPRRARGPGRRPSPGTTSLPRPEPRRRRRRPRRSAGTARLLGSGGWLDPILDAGSPRPAAWCARRWRRPRRSPTLCSRCRRSAPRRCTRRRSGGCRGPLAPGRGERRGDGRVRDDRAGGRSDVAGLATTHGAQGTASTGLNGIKTLISNAGIADFYTVFASTDPPRAAKGISCFLVPADDPGLRFVRALESERAASAGRDRLRRLPGSGGGSRLGEEGGGFRLGLATLDRLRPTVAPRPAAWRRARSMKRWPTLRPAGSSVSRSPSSSWCRRSSPAWRPTSPRPGCWSIARRGRATRGRERITLEAAMAKAFATEAAQRIVDDAVQIWAVAGCSPTIRWTGCTARCGRFGSTKGPPRSSS